MLTLLIALAAASQEAPRTAMPPRTGPAPLVCADAVRPTVSTGGEPLDGPVAGLGLMLMLFGLSFSWDVRTRRDLTAGGACVFGALGLLLASREMAMLRAAAAHGASEAVLHPIVAPGTE